MGELYHGNKGVTCLYCVYNRFDLTIVKKRIFFFFCFFLKALSIFGSKRPTSTVDHVAADLFGGLVVRLRHVGQYENESCGGEHGVRAPHLNRMALNENFERLHDHKRYGPGKRRRGRLYAIPVRGGHQLDTDEPRDGAQAQPEGRNVRAQD